jgi:hypothetical protein
VSWPYADDALPHTKARARANVPSPPFRSGPAQGPAQAQTLAELSSLQLRNPATLPGWIPGILAIRCQEQRRSPGRRA